MSKSMLTSLLPNNVKLFPAAADDFLSLDKGRQIKVIKALQKISKSPTKFGKTLENKPDRPLSGFRSIYVDNKSIRIIWKVTASNQIEVAVVAGIAERDGLFAYKLVSSRKEAVEVFMLSLEDK
jgi:mRNA interferase RelE/StbE